MSTRRLTSRSWQVLVVAGLAGAGLVASGCAGPGLAYRSYHDEGGSGVSQDAFVYVSRPHEPKTVTVMDTRTGEALWTMDVPVGRKLVIDFEENKADGTPDRPDLMRWELMDASDLTGRLGNAMPVPIASARRIDMTLRTGPESGR